MINEIKLLLPCTAVLTMFLVGMGVWGYTVRKQDEKDFQCVYSNPDANQYVKDCSYRQSTCRCLINAVELFGCKDTPWLLMLWQLKF